MLDLLSYYLQLLFLTLGTLALCGLAVRLCALAFGHLSGAFSGKFFDVTAALGTPVHELGHAMMCPIFAHKVTGMCLWSPRHVDGRYGYVEHSYKKSNLWARIGNIFIGLGPLFSGLGVVVLSLWLCFPALWKEYLSASSTAISSGTTDVGALLGAVFSLLFSMPAAIAADPIRAILGILLILSVALHVSLSTQDIKESLRALPLYLLIMAVVALITYVTRLNGFILSFLRLANLRLVSLFALVIGFCLVWVLGALLVRLIRKLIGWF